MGWCTGKNEDAGHEGFIAAVVREENRFRELRYPNDNTDRNVLIVQVACECGWRSPRLWAPFETKYFPYVVLIGRQDAAFEEKCQELWRKHVSDASLMDRSWIVF